MRFMAGMVALAAVLIATGCARLEGKPGTGNQPTGEGGIFGNGRSIEENRKVGSPGSD